MTVEETKDIKKTKTNKKNNVKKGLKKGSLEFLLSSTGLNGIDSISSVSKNKAGNKKNINNNQPVSKSDTGSVGDKVATIAIEKVIRSPYQPRTHFSQQSLQELSDSIKAKGLIQPLTVRKNKDQYELIAGERRWRACQLAGLHDVQVVIKDVDNETAMVMAVVENIQREDLNALEEARGFKRLIDEFGLTQLQVSTVVGKSRSTIANLLRLLGLNVDVQTMLEQNKIEMGHARALLSLKEDLQLKVANRIILKKASVRDSEKWVREVLNPPAVSAKQDNDFSDDPNIKSLENSLSEILSAKISIEHTDMGKGRLVINYFSLDELDGIVTKFGQVKA